MPPHPPRSHGPLEHDPHHQPTTQQKSLGTGSKI
jgi:hypothetical protein